METIEELLSHPLAQILCTPGTRNSGPGSSKHDFIDRNLLFPWKSFTTEVQNTIKNADLSNKLTVTDHPEGELVMVGNKHGLIGRFQANVRSVLGRAFNASPNEKLNRIRFGDSQVVSSYRDMGEADVLMVTYPLLQPQRTTCRVVGLFKTFWTQEYIGYARASEISTPDYSDNDNGVDPRVGLICLESPIGQLSRYMVKRKLRYGFLSTYEHTIFVKRTGRTRFEISDPIKWDDVSPTVRQCFFHIGTLGAGDDYSYHDSDTEETLQMLRRGRLNEKGAPLTNFPNDCCDTPGDTPGECHGDDEDEDHGGQVVAGPSGEQTTRPAPSEMEAATHNITTAVGTPEMTTFHLKGLTVQSVIFGEGRISQHFFEIQKTLHTNSKRGKRVLVGTFNGVERIAKYFPATEIESYRDERDAYLILPQTRHFPQMLAFGDIVLSQDLRDGHIIILSKEKGVPLDYEMIDEMIQSERLLVREGIISAVRVLRSAGARHGDPGPQNVLWDRDSGHLVMLDFEFMRKSGRNVPADHWEVDRILGWEWSQELKRTHKQMSMRAQP
ncbi:hypothetical protein TWF481_009559 [Arthrobotrys musiformis]|uniref:Protein kinase domain-containing protein n=1 Tax=Arthrobotrys musiformis TaxID=47236 RepID=A0AAV9W689_9PEZI